MDLEARSYLSTLASRTSTLARRQLLWRKLLVAAQQVIKATASKWAVVLNMTAPCIPGAKGKSPRLMSIAEETLDVSYWPILLQKSVDVCRGP